MSVCLSVCLPVCLSIYGGTPIWPPKKFFRGGWRHVHVHHISMFSLRLHVFICCYWQVAYLKFEARVMAFNDLVAKIYRCLHEMCTSFGTNTKVQFGCLLSTVLSSTKNTALYRINWWRKCVVSLCWLWFLCANYITCTLTYWVVARQMAMIRGYKTILLSWLTRFHRLNEWKQKPHI